MRCAGGAGRTVEVVVISIVNYDLGGFGIPGIKVSNLSVDCAKDGSEVNVKSSLLSSEESHTCNSLGDSTCAGVVILNELNGRIGGMDAVHGDVTGVLVVRGIVACNGDVAAKLGINNCYCRICAPGTADCGLACGNALVSGELTLIEDCTVNDSIICSLVRALEGGEVACGTLIVLLGIDNVDSTVLEVCGIVSTEDEVGVTRDEYVLEVLTTCEELKGILDTKKLRVLHSESVSLNKECKTSLNCKACRIHSILGVPVVGNSDVLDSYVSRRLSDSNGLSRVGGVSESACVNKAVERSPLDNYFIGIFAQTDNVEVGNLDLKLFLVKTGSDAKLLNSSLINLCSKVKSALNCAEYVVRTADSTCDTKVVGINEKLVYAVCVSSRLNLSDMNFYSCINSVCRDCKSTDVSSSRIEAGYNVGGNGEALHLLAALTKYPYGKTGIVKLLTYKVNFLEAVVVVNAITCGGVAGKLFNRVEEELNRLGSVVIYVNCNGNIFLVGNYNGICTGNSGINRRGVNRNAVKCKRLCLAVSECCVKSEAGEIKLVAYEIINLTLGNKLKAVLIRLLNDAREAKLEDILSTTVLTTADHPLTCGNVKLDLNNGATAVSTKEFDIMNSTVGSSYGNELHSCTGGTVLDKEGKLTCAGNVYLDLGSRVTDLNRLLVLNALVSLGSVSDLGAGYDIELTVDAISGQSTGLKIGDVEVIAYLLHIFGNHILATRITCIVAVLVYVVTCGNVVRIGLTALALTFYEVVSVRGNIFGICCATATQTINKVMYVFAIAAFGLPIGITDIGNLRLRNCVNCRLTEVTNKVCVSVNVLTCGLFRRIGRLAGCKHNHRKKKHNR